MRDICHISGVIFVFTVWMSVFLSNRTNECFGYLSPNIVQILDVSVANKKGVWVGISNIILFSFFLNSFSHIVNTHGCLGFKFLFIAHVTDKNCTYEEHVRNSW